ncbi:MAG: hypothetical protein IPM56_08450 [Ignavibacteriales bacterium]|nr:MAG: hypothetical protein IPM56_08450 [Ignavibacteriales bacterium]
MNNFLNEVPGQLQAKKLLNSILDSSNIPHAFLLTGKEGIGKFFLSIKFLQALNKKYSSDKESEIKNHRTIQNCSEPIVKLIFPLPRGRNESENSGPFEKLSSDEIELISGEIETKTKNPYHKINIPKANDIRINSIRDISKFLSFSYGDIKFRSVILIDSHLMNEAAQNALLKNLEEPPEGVIFFLLTPYPEQLRETIRSRCWQIKFQPLEVEDIINVLTTYFNIEKKMAERAARFSSGSVDTAIALVDTELDKLLERTIIFLRFALGNRFEEALTTGSEFLNSDKQDMIKILISLIIAWFADVVRWRAGKDPVFYFEYLDTIEKFNSKFSELVLADIMFNLDRLSMEVDRNINQNLILLKLVYELAFFIKRGAKV